MGDKDYQYDLSHVNDVIDVIKCDLSWPVCIFDFSIHKKLPQFFIYKTKYYPGKIKENHFYGEYDKYNVLIDE